jgi:hypothetical protein
MWQTRKASGFFSLNGLVVLQACTVDPSAASAQVASPPLCIFFKGRAVVASAGALHTPALLLRSGIKGQGNTGRHLRLHPATVAVGFFPKMPGAGASRCLGVFSVYKSICIVVVGSAAGTPHPFALILSYGIKGQSNTGHHLRLHPATVAIGFFPKMPGVGEAHHLGVFFGQVHVYRHVEVASAGALHAPALLLRSGIKCQRNTGRHLQLQPATAAVGLFPKMPGMLSSCCVLFGW